MFSFSAGLWLLHTFTHLSPLPPRSLKHLFLCVLEFTKDCKQLPTSMKDHKNIVHIHTLNPTTDQGLVLCLTSNNNYYVRKLIWTRNINSPATCFSNKDLRLLIWLTICRIYLKVIFLGIPPVCGTASVGGYVVS